MRIIIIIMLIIIIIIIIIIILIVVGLIIKVGNDNNIALKHGMCYCGNNIWKCRHEPRARDRFIK